MSASRPALVAVPAPLASPREDSGSWLTTVLHPSGVLDELALERLTSALTALSVSADVVIIDLSSAVVGDTSALTAALRVPAQLLERDGGTLLVIEAPPRTVRELRAGGVNVVTETD